MSDGKNMYDIFTSLLTEEITKSDVCEVMSGGDENEIAELWEKIEELGGYDNLPD